MVQNIDRKEVKESIRGGYDQENMPEELVAYYKIEMIRKPNWKTKEHSVAVPPV